MSAALKFSTGSKPKSKKKGRPFGNKDFLEPIRSEPKRKLFATIDIESKDGCCCTLEQRKEVNKLGLDNCYCDGSNQKAGFQRPFLVGFYDPHGDGVDGDYMEFADEPHLRSDPKRWPWRRRHVSPGGCIDKLLNVILTKKYSGYIFYSHNGGNFDELFLLTWLQEHRDEFGFELIPIQSTIQVIRVWRIPENPGDKIKEKWEFLDSMRLMPFGLEKACQSFGVPGKISHDLDMLEGDPRWSEYLEQDCRSLCAVITKFYDLVMLRFNSEVGITTPSTAMKLFRKGYLGQHGVQERINRFAHWETCVPPKTGEECLGCAHDWIRLGYYGGRTEIFRLWGRALHYYDINSSYVAAMRERMPIGDRLIERAIEGRPLEIDWRKHHSRGGEFAGFAECRVFIPDTCPIPPLPHRGEFNKLEFPTGSFSGVWSLEELLLVTDPLVGGRIEEVTKIVWFKLQPMFGKMVEDLWRYRDKTLADYDEGLSTLAKLLGNSAYGKFAMKQERTSIVFTQDSEPDELGQPTRCFLCREVVQAGVEICNACVGSKSAMHDPSMPHDGDVWYQAKKVDAPYIIPHVASHITALARVRLWMCMRRAILTPSRHVWTTRPRSADERKVRHLGPVGEEHLFDVSVDRDGFRVADRLRGIDKKEASELYRVERTLIISDVIFINRGTFKGEEDTVHAGHPALVVSLDRRSAIVRFLSDERGDEGEYARIDLDAVVVRGGRIFYSDTDSVITDVVLHSSAALGALKDEYVLSRPLRGDEVLVDATNVVVVEGLVDAKMLVAGRVLRVRVIGREPKEKGKDERAKGLMLGEKGEALARVVFPIKTIKQSVLKVADDPADSEIDYVAVQPKVYRVTRHVRVTAEDSKSGAAEVIAEHKITMKGFPQKQRTKANLEKLAGKGERKDRTLEWEQLEKVRSLAGIGFRRPPRLIQPNKSFQTPYEKRIITEDGATRARVLPQEADHQGGRRKGRASNEG